MRIAYQGISGAYSHGAVVKHYPGAEAVPQPNFSYAVNALVSGQVDAALLPFENLLAGRVSGLHDLLENMDNLHIHREHYVSINHCLLGKGTLADVENVYSHPQALAQCRNFLHKNNLCPVTYSDTAAAAEFVSQSDDNSIASISSAYAAELYGLNVLATDIANQDQNVTRFLLWKREEPAIIDAATPAVTSIYFSLKHRVNALYEVLTIFAEQQMNLLKIESYVAPGTFDHASFYIEVEANTAIPEHSDAIVKVEKLCNNFINFGCYPKERGK